MKKYLWSIYFEHGTTFFKEYFVTYKRQLEVVLEPGLQRNAFILLLGQVVSLNQLLKMVW